MSGRAGGQGGPAGGGGAGPAGGRERPAAGRASLGDRIRGLTAEKRQLLDLLLRDKVADLSRLPVPRGAPAGGGGELSFAQERMWMLARMLPGSPLYNIPAVFRLSGELDAAALAACLAEIERRQGALRTAFPVVAGRPVQQVEPPAAGGAVRLPLVDLAALPGPSRQREEERLVAATAGQPFDLGRGPVWRALLLRGGRDRHVLAAVFHHIVFDDWSMGVFYRELAALYPALRDRRPPSLAELPVQYSDFAPWQRRWLRGRALAPLRLFWTRQLAGMPPLLALPADRPRPAVQSFRGAARLFRLRPELGQALREVGRGEGATLFMVLLAAFQALLHRASGRRDVPVGSMIANRPRLELEGLIGCFANTLVLRTEVGPELTFRQLLGRVREVTSAAYAHQDLPFEMVLEAAQAARSSSHSPLFQVMLVLENARGDLTRLGEVAVSPVVAAGVTAKFDLLLYMLERGEEILGSLEYSTDLFTAATAGRIVEQLCALLGRVAAGPGRPLAELLDGLGWEGGAVAEEDGAVDGALAATATTATRDATATMAGAAAARGAAATTATPGAAAARGAAATMGATATAAATGMGGDGAAAEGGPMSPIEEGVAAIFAEVLRRDGVERRSNLFALGGDSLRATRVLLRVEERWQIELSLQELVQAPTVGGLALRILERLGQRGRGEELLARVAGLSEEEAETMLAGIADPEGPPERAGAAGGLGPSVDPGATR